jgi:hypothetical protein
MNVALIGASDKKHRYSYKAFQLLKEKGHSVFPVHQRVKSIEGEAVYASVKDIKEPVDTVSMYVASDVSSALAEDILSLEPRRLIFNPGAENPQLEERAKAAGVECLNACTLVMLNTGRF